MNNEKIIVAVETDFHVPKMNWYRRWKLKRANKRRLKNLKKHGIVELIEHEEDYVKYNAENGWGNTADARETLVSIMAWVSDTRYAGEIPIECIWIAW